jgi:hypothetical protein
MHTTICAPGGMGSAQFALYRQDGALHRVLHAFAIRLALPTGKIGAVIF